jgi:hypothetical protein
MQNNLKKIPIILAGLKISDVYVQISNARKSLEYMYIDDYGGLVSPGDPDSVLKLKAKFLFDALALYNYCVDLSMQFLYLLTSDATAEDVFNDSYYLEQIKECRYRSLISRLKSKNEELLLEKIEFCMANHLFKVINEAQNYIKHRGTYHIDGLDDYHDGFAVLGINDKTVHFIKRRVLDLKEFSQLLISFDREFVRYFNDLISWTMPSNFYDSRVSPKTQYNFLIYYDERF